MENNFKKLENLRKWVGHMRRIRSAIRTVQRLGVLDHELAMRLTQTQEALERDYKEARAEYHALDAFLKASHHD